jgi:hypothetical protein
MKECLNQVRLFASRLDGVRERHDGLAKLIERYVPADTDPVQTDLFRQRWLSALPKARRVTVKWVDKYGWRLMASWLASDGTELISLGRPEKRAESLRDFVRNWQTYMQKQGIGVHVDWDDPLGGNERNSRVAG